MGWHNWCAGEPNSGSSSSCNIFYGEKFSMDNYCWLVLIDERYRINHYQPVFEPGMTQTARTNGATCVKSPSVRVTYLSKILFYPWQFTVSALRKFGWTVDSSRKMEMIESSYGTKNSFIGLPDQTDHLNIIDSNMDTKWTANERRDWIQVDMKTSHYVHRVHIGIDDV